MDYFEAVQKGRERVKAAIDVLQEAAGPCYPMLFLKLGIQDWTPVGEEKLFSIVAGKSGTAAVVICDNEGNSKAMTTWVPSVKAQEYCRSLESRGVARFDGEVKLPV